MANNSYSTVIFLLMSYLVLKALIVVPESSNVFYTRTGENILINCSNPNVSLWQFYDSKEILAQCDNSDKRINRINKDLNRSSRLNITANCDRLQIQNFSIEDVGTYMCLYTTKDSKGSNTYKINIQLRNIRITEANNSGRIKGIEGENVFVTCIIQGLFSDETLYLIKDRRLLNSGKPPSLSSMFTASPIDNEKELLCSANNSQSSITTSVQMDIILKPHVSIHASPSLIIRNGTHLELNCLEDSGRNVSIDNFLWTLDGDDLSSTSAKLVFQNADQSISGEYICTAKNAAGKNSSAVNVTILLPPVVLNTQIVFQADSKERTLECNVTGVPATYTFGEWRHFTEQRQLIRVLDGNGDGTLTLPKVMQDHVYEDTGVYFCNVSNGIADDGDSLWKLGKIEVIVEGKPVLTKPKNHIFIGNYNETSTINIFVLSSSPVLEANWLNNKTNQIKTKACVPCVTQADFFETTVNISAYKCEYEIETTKEEDLQNYSVKISNECGESTFITSLLSAKRPKQPTTISWLSSTNYIFAQFKPGFDGGYDQTFVVQYRKISTGMWKSIEVENSNKLVQDYYINNLEPSTLYELRMFAQNKLGNSTVTDVHSILTKDESYGSGTKYFGLALGLFIIGCLIAIWWRLRIGKKNDPHRSVSNEQQIQEAGVIVNNLYGSSVVLQGSSTASGRRADVYSSIDRNRQNVDSQEVSYTIAGERKRKKFQLAGRKETKEKNERVSSKLNYIDVVFESKPHNGKFYIHGADDRTPYADIDFSAKAEPLISSDDDDKRSINGENICDDFVSLEDVQQWNITED